MNGISIDHPAQCLQLPEIKKDREDLKRMHSQVVQDVLKRVEKAFDNFFRRVKEGKNKAGFPRFRSDRRYDSFTYPQKGFDLDQKTKKLHLSKIGSVKVHLSRLVEGKIKTCTIKREADGWYAIFAVEEASKPVALAPDETIGVDVGLKTFAALSNGEQIDNPRFLRQGEAELKKAQRGVSRRRKGSHRRKKAIKVLAKKHQRVARQRRDFHFKEAKKLTTRFRVIKFEDLNITGRRGMVKNHGLAKSISDAGWSQFMNIVAHKAEEAGGQASVVNPSYTSQNCSRCKARHAMPLSVRVYRCSRCGLVICRDVNAAINIKERNGRAVRSPRGKVASFDDVSTYHATDMESPAKAGPPA